MKNFEKWLVVALIVGIVFGGFMLADLDREMEELETEFDTYVATITRCKISIKDCDRYINTLNRQVEACTNGNDNN